jgi:hypothetical protein
MLNLPLACVLDRVHFDKNRLLERYALFVPINSGPFRAVAAVSFQSA